MDGHIKQDKNGPWWFRKVKSWIPAEPNNPNNGQKENVLIIWRKLTGDLEQDKLKLDDKNWKIRLIEEEFIKRILKNIFQSRELQEDSVVRKFRNTATDGEIAFTVRKDIFASFL